MKYIIKTVQSLEECGILVKGETIENKAEGQTGEFLVILSSTLGGVYILKLILSVSCYLRWRTLLILPHPLTNFPIKRNHWNEESI